MGFIEETSLDTLLRVRGVNTLNVTSKKEVEDFKAELIKELQKKSL